MDIGQGRQILEYKDRIIANFTRENWSELGLLTGFTDLIQSHARLLRSLDFGDEDYIDNVLNVLTGMAHQQPSVLDTIETYLDSKFEGNTYYVSRSTI